MSETEERARLVAEAKSWLGTPYRSAADVKGAGVDCVMLLIRAFVDAGMIAPVDPRPFPEQWAVHQAEELYLAAVRERAHEVAPPPARMPLPADVVLFRMARVYAHGAIVLDWPYVIHVMRRPQEVMIQDCERTGLLMRLEKKFFSLWPRTV
jgi:cell wall-associated NlpC family hydrolase